MERFNAFPLPVQIFNVYIIIMSYPGKMFSLKFNYLSNSAYRMALSQLRTRNYLFGERA